MAYGIDINIGCAFTDASGAHEEVHEVVFGDDGAADADTTHRTWLSRSPAGLELEGAFA